MHHVIAIGASAGGLDALRLFFASADVNHDIVYLVAQHLSPSHRSLMPELLARHTEIGVHAATDGTTLVPGNAYLLPPAFDMVLAGDRVRLTPRQDDGNLHLPIDRLFSSVAAEQGARAAVVVLSGLGSDGTAGLRDIKAAGGIVAAQEPKTAQFDGMPRNAIATGLVDVVAAPDLILDAVLRALEYPVVDDEGIVDDDERAALDRALWAVAQHTGVDFSEYKPSTLLRRIRRRISESDADTLSDYANTLAEDPGEADTLLREMLINVTRFFRDTPVFEHLRNSTIPEIIDKARSGGRTIRVWSVGCATGEEAYSIALMMRAGLEDLKADDVSLKIFATDVDQGAIEEAGSGVFSEGVAAEIPGDLVKRYFSRREGSLVIHRSIRDSVVFARHNALVDPPLTRMDLVVCRNFMIYLETNAQQHLLRRLSFALHPNATLVLGSSETVGDLADRFEVVDRRLRIYRSRGRMLPTDIGHVRGRSWKRRRNPSTSATVDDPDAHSARSMLLEGYAPPAVLIDDSLNLVHVFGKGATVLRIAGGPVSMNLSSVLPRTAASAIGAGVHRVRERGEQVLIPALRLWPDSAVSMADVRIQPLSSAGGGPPRFLISFEPPLHLAAHPGPTAVDPADMDEVVAERIRFLEEGLAQTQERLHAAIEELESSNEELQATNEELLSSNEELQSTNEELQSVNEEMHTINTEYQNKIIELSDLNADMDNLFQSTSIGTLFLDSGFRVRRFTSAAADVLPLLPRDLDRPIAHFARHFPGVDLDTLARRVFRSDEPVEHEVEVNDERSVLLRLSVLHDANGVKAGVVMNFVDITKLRRTERTQAAVLDGLPEHIAVVDDKGVIRFVNDAWNAFAAATTPAGEDLDAVGTTFADSLSRRALDETHAERALTGVDRVVRGLLPAFSLEYSCYSRASERRFVLRAAPLRTKGDGAVVSHQDVTDRHIAQLVARKMGEDAGVS